MFAVYASDGNLENPLAALVVGERPEPVVPEGWVRVKVSHASLNRHDIFTLMGVTAQAAPLGPAPDIFFAVSSLLIAIPTGVKVFNWTATLWGGSIRFTTSMCFAIAFLIQFVIGLH